MKTYQDLLACGQDERARMDFIASFIREHCSSAVCRAARDARLYYSGENPTINRYEKIIYDMQGRAHRDLWTANHKIASSFFGFAVDQLCGYLLGNGVMLKKEAKARLGKSFDRKVSRAAEASIIGGVSFGFWNFDHIEVFDVTEFAPMYDEENGALMAGVRFWQIAPDKPLRATLYEPDGYTEYIRRKDEDMQVLSPKRAYILRVTGAALDSTRIYDGENYATFPIVPLKYNNDCRSDICGKRNTIDALDLACSNMINNVDEGNLIYWVLTNCAGMDDLDDARFIEQLKVTHVMHADGDDGARAEAHTVEAPFTGTQTAIDMLQKKLYQDFQAFDASAVTAGNQTATAIKASYVPLDLKADKFERQVTEFIQGIFAIAGIDDEPTYTRNRIVNTQEEMQTLLLLAPYVDETYIAQKGLTLLGDADKAEELARRRAAETLGRFSGVDGQEDVTGDEA